MPTTIARVIVLERTGNDLERALIMLVESAAVADGSFGLPPSSPWYLGRL
ncbi:MAG: hypothetical protein WBE89_11575 [Methyloceanibacter sp.]